MTRIYKPEERNSVKNNNTFENWGKLYFGAISSYFRPNVSQKYFPKNVDLSVFSIYSTLTSSRLLGKFNEWSVRYMMNIATDVKED